MKLGPQGVEDILETAVKKLGAGFRFLHGRHHPMAPVAGYYVTSSKKTIDKLLWIIPVGGSWDIFASVSFEIGDSNVKSFTIKVNDKSVLPAMEMLARDLEATTSAEVEIVY